jgi:hypothetical protein
MTLAERPFESEGKVALDGVKKAISDRNDALKNLANTPTRILGRILLRISGYAFLWPSFPER